MLFLGTILSDRWTHIWCWSKHLQQRGGFCGIGERIWECWLENSFKNIWKWHFQDCDQDRIENERRQPGGHTWGPWEGGEGGGVALSSERWRQGAWPLSLYPTQGGIYIRGRQQTKKERKQVKRPITLSPEISPRLIRDRPPTFKRGVPEALGARRPSSKHVCPHVGRRDRRSSIPWRQLGLGLEGQR